MTGRVSGDGESMINDPMQEIMRRVDVYIQGLGWEHVSTNFDVPEVIIRTRPGPLEQAYRLQPSSDRRWYYRRIWVEEGIVVEAPVESYETPD